MADLESEHYLLDTNIISELIKNEPNFKVVQKIAMHSSDMAISVVTLNEMLFGINLLSDGYRKNELLNYVQDDVRENFKVKIFGEKAAEINAQICAQMQLSGTKVSFDDSMIASIAIAEDMILATRNVKHFEAIAKKFPLKIENWFE